MKKLLTAAIIPAACAALCVAMWPRSGETVTVLGNTAMSTTSPAPTETQEPSMVCLAKNSELPETAEKEKIGTVTAAERIPTPVAEPAVTAAEPSATVQVIASQTTPSSGTDPYHTDIYPENVYSEEFIYDTDGNLIGKTTTYPTAFDSDTVWIDGKAYGNVPGFGLVEWGGPSSVTEDYIMYESGNKVGIMGGEEDASATQPPTDWLEPTGEVIDQTIGEAPERSSTSPNYKPDNTPPNDPNARIIP